MHLTAEEKMMYAVMKAIYDSAIPISFKGSMVLKACLMEAGFLEDTRHTVDIDANWNADTSPTGEQMVASLQNALVRSGINLEVSIFRPYGEGRSAGFELKDCGTDEVLFSMDIDVNRPIPPTIIYEVEGLRFRGVSSSQMIADKVVAISTDKVFRRVKDIVDLYYMSKVFPFDKPDILQTIENSGRELDRFHGFLHKPTELKHAYEKFRFEGGVFKPPFEEVYRAVKAYIRDVLPKERNRNYER